MTLNAMKVFVHGTGVTCVAIVQMLTKALKEHELYLGVTTEQATEGPIKHITVQDSVESLKSTFKTLVPKVLILVPWHLQNKVQFCTNCVEAAKDSSIELIIAISVVGVGFKGEEENKYVKPFEEIENIVKSSGIMFTIIRSQFLMQNLLYYSKTIRESRELRLPIGDGRFSPIDVKDVARLVTLVLSCCNADENEKLITSGDYFLRDYNLTGPEVLSGYELSSSITEGLGIHVHYVDIEMQQAKEDLVKLDLNETEIDEMLMYYSLVRHGKMNVISHDTENVTGSKGQNVKDFFEEASGFVLNKGTDGHVNQVAEYCSEV